MGARCSETGPETHPVSCTVGTGSFPGVERPGPGIDHSPPSSAEVKERVEPPLWAFVACYKINFTLLGLESVVFRFICNDQWRSLLKIVMNLQEEVPSLTQLRSLVLLGGYRRFATSSC